MSELFIAVLLGHFVADYLMQPTWMAIGKSEPGVKGMLICFQHCVVYTVIVLAFVGVTQEVVGPRTGAQETRGT